MEVQAPASNDQHDAATQVKRPARDRVLDIPELFESILAELTLPQILSLKPMCKTWDAFISYSDHVRHAFQFKTSVGTSTFYPNPRRRILLPHYVQSYRRPSSTLQECQAISQPRSRYYATAKSSCIEYAPIFAWEEDLRINPIFMKRYGYGPIDSMFLVLEIKSPRAIRMQYLTQPPVTKALLYLYEPDHPEVFGSLTLSDDHGITLGLIEETGVSMLEQIHWDEVGENIIYAIKVVFLMQHKDVEVSASGMVEDVFEDAVWWYDFFDETRDLEEWGKYPASNWGRRYVEADKLNDGWDERRAPADVDPW